MIACHSYISIFLDIWLFDLYRISPLSHISHLTSHISRSAFRIPYPVSPSLSSRIRIQQFDLERHDCKPYVIFISRIVFSLQQYTTIPGPPRSSPGSIRRKLHQRFHLRLISHPSLYPRSLGSLARHPSSLTPCSDIALRGYAGPFAPATYGGRQVAYRQGSEGEP